MRTVLKMWGNSLAIRIPKAVAGDTGLSAGQEVELTVEKGCLIISAVQPEREYSLEGLLDAITEENLHGETDFGASQRREEI